MIKTKNLEVIKSILNSNELDCMTGAKNFLPDCNRTQPNIGSQNPNCKSGIS